MWKIHIGGRKYRYFDTLDEARKFASDYFERTGIVVGIVAVR